MSGLSELPPANPQLQAAELSADLPTVPRPWGFWATLGFTLIFALVFVAMLFIVIFALMAVGVNDASVSTTPSKTDMTRMESTALLAHATAAGIVIPICCIVVAALRKGITIREYLALRSVAAKTLLVWLGLALIVGQGFDLLTWLLGRDVIPEFMTNTRETVAWLPLLWIGVVFGAPFWEEFFFRGFLLAGFKNSFLRTQGAVPVVSLCWAGMHWQYDWFGMTSIFVLGLMLGYARIHSGSLWVPIAMHALHNFIATVELELYLRYWSPQ